MKPLPIISALLLSLTGTHGQTPRFRITMQTHRSGIGGIGAPFSISGTVGQSDAVRSGNGRFAFRGGFWTAFGEGRPLRIVPSAGSLVLRWPSRSAGVLQRTTNLSAPGGGWVDVMEEPVITGPSRELPVAELEVMTLFRLRQP